MGFDQLPDNIQKHLKDLEQRVTQWDDYGKAMARPTAQLTSISKKAAAQERFVAKCHEVQRQDEALLATFKEQVGATLGDARRAEQDFQRRHEQPAGSVPSAFFLERLRAHEAEVETLTAHIKQLEAATSLRGSSHLPPGAELTPSAMRELMQQQAQLFERAAGRLQLQHSKTDALRQRVKRLLGHDPCAEARNRKLYIRDKHKPPDEPMQQLPAPPSAQQPAANPLAPAAPGAAPAPAANPFGLAPAPAAGANPFGGGALGAGAATPAAGGGLLGAANPFTAAKPPAAAPAGGGLFGAAPAAPAASPFGAAPAASPFGAPPTAAAPAAGGGGLFGAAPAAAGGGLFGAPPAAGGGLFGGPATPAAPKASQKKKSTGRR